MIILPLLTQGQDNLVPNGNFEIQTSCPTGISQFFLATPWTNTGGVGSPDYHNACNTGSPSGLPHMGVPANGRGFQHAHSGDAYMGFIAFQAPNGREFLQVELINPMQAGTTYVITFYTSLADKFLYSIGTLGVLFTDTLFVHQEYSISNMDVLPTVNGQENVNYNDKENWMMFTDTFTSRFGGERFMTIGNFKQDYESDTINLGTGDRDGSYYYIDDVSVFALDSMPSGVGVSEQEAVGFDVYPNPSNGRFEVRASEPLRQEAKLIIYDTQGRALLRQQMQKGMSSTTVNTEHLAKGVYTLRLLSDDGSSGWGKVVVQ